MWGSMAKDSPDKQENNKGDKRGLHPSNLKNLEKRHSGHKHNSKDHSITSLTKRELARNKRRMSPNAQKNLGRRWQGNSSKKEMEKEIAYGQARVNLHL